MIAAAWYAVAMPTISSNKRRFVSAKGWLIAPIVLLFIAAAFAQEAERPTLKVGDSWHFVMYYTVPSTTPNRAWVITSVTLDGIEGTENGELLKLTPELNVLDSPRTRESNPQTLKFPLEVGKRWRYSTEWLFKAKGSKGSSNYDVAVTGYEKIKVPAGEFDAFKLGFTASLHGTSPIGSHYGGDVTSTYWYAPKARAIVKSVTHNPYIGTSTVELVRYELEP